MTFMAFSQLSGDMSSVSENLELARRLYGAEGASRVAGSIAMTGQNVGAFTLSTIWDSSDACFAARAKVLATEEMQAAMAAAQAQPLSFAVGTIFGERGTCEGSHVVAVVGSSSNPTDDVFTVAAAGLKLDTMTEVRQWASRIKVRTVDSKDMPFMNKTGMLPEERETLGQWILAGAPLPN